MGKPINQLQGRAWQDTKVVDQVRTSCVGQVLGKKRKINVSNALLAIRMPFVIKILNGNVQVKNIFYNGTTFGVQQIED